jgi:hypothetical protein
MNCTKRNVPCIPQGDIQPGSPSESHNASIYTEREEVPGSYYLSFFDGLDHLRRWVELPTSSSTPSHMSPISQAPTELHRRMNDPGIVHSEHAPVMKLFNDFRVSNPLTLKQHKANEY